MAIKRKQRLPKEDLEATVAEIFNNPITKINLGFLQLSAQETDDQRAEEMVEVSPAGDDLKPMGSGIKPLGPIERPAAPTPTSQPVVPWIEETPGEVAEPTGVPGEILRGFDPRPMGLVAKPAGVAIKPGGVISKPPGVTSKPVGDAIPVSVPASSQAMFLAEQIGTLFPASRVRRIRLAQEALSHVEEKVYDLLWGVKNQSKDQYRFADFSLQRIANEARINIKTVRELLPRLIDKGFIGVEREADVRRNRPTRYRVWSYGEVLAQQQKRNRLWVVKTGKGVFYARPVSVGVTTDTSLVEDAKLDVVSTPMGVALGPGGSASTPSGSIAEPVGVNETMESGLLGSLARMIRNSLGLEADEPLLAAIVHDCRQRSRSATGTTATDEEILHFCRVKTSVFARASNLRNPLGVLRIAVPECFSGQPFLDYRAAEAERRQQELDELRRYEEMAEAPSALDNSYELVRAVRGQVSERHRNELGYDLKGIAEDPELDDQGREVARERMKRLGRYASHGL